MPHGENDRQPGASGRQPRQPSLGIELSKGQVGKQSLWRLGATWQHREIQPTVGEGLHPFSREIYT